MFVQDVSDLLPEAMKIVKDAVEKPVMECLLKRSKILRSCLKHRPADFLELVEDDTLVISGAKLRWLEDHSEHIRTMMEFQTHGDCPKNRFMLCPEEKAIYEDFGDASSLFEFLQHYVDGKPVGEYHTEHKELFFDLYPQFRKLPEVLDALMWDHRKADDQLDDLIKVGLLVKRDEDFVAKRPSFPHKEFRLKKHLEAQKKKFHRRIEDILEDRGNNDNNNNFDYNNNNNDNRPRLVHNERNSYLRPVKASKLHGTRKYSEKRPGIRAKADAKGKKTRKVRIDRKKAKYAAKH